MRAILLTLIVAVVAAPALAVVPQQGDIFYIGSGGGGLYHLDGGSGAETLVSCSDISRCNPLIGSGPEIGNGFYNHVQIGADGRIYLYRITGGSGAGIFVRIEPENGNREYVATPSIAPSYGFLIYPAPSFFPVTVASLGTWGLVMLVVGIFIGVQLRMRNAAEA